MEEEKYVVFLRYFYELVDNELSALEKLSEEGNSDKLVDFLPHTLAVLIMTGFVRGEGRKQEMPLGLVSVYLQNEGISQGREQGETEQHFSKLIEVLNEEQKEKFKEKVLEMYSREAQLTA